MDVDDEDMDRDPGPPSGAATKRGIDEAYGSGNHVVVRGNKMFIAGTRGVNDAVNEDVHAMVWGAKTTELMRIAEDMLSRNEQVTYVTGHSLGALVADDLAKDHRHLIPLAIAPPKATKAPAVRSENDLISWISPAQAAQAQGWNTHAMANMDEALIERGWDQALEAKGKHRTARRSVTPGSRTRRWTRETPSTTKTRKGSRPPRERTTASSIEVPAAAVSVPDPDMETALMRQQRRRESSARRSIIDVARGPRARSQVRIDTDKDISDAFPRTWTRMRSTSRAPGAASSFEAPGGGGFG